MFTGFLLTVVGQSDARLLSMLNGEGSDIIERVVMSDS